ncbi:MAG TPA: hypothetical protein VMX97_16955 [Hyphomicrobiaceae bacterium]|nr:hypothetical protein [Hyphomicrobiaceae bacterium]
MNAITSNRIDALDFGGDAAMTQVAERGAGKGFFARMLAGLIVAREAEAKRRMAAYLPSVSDRRLLELGLSAHDIQLMRESGRVPPTIWS